MKSNYILTCDPSFTEWGWAIVDVISNQIIEQGCIKTAPESKVKRIRKSDDRVRRISEINKILLGLLKKYDIQLIVSEAPHGSQNAMAAVMIGCTLGILQTISDCISIPIEYYSEQECKKQVLNKKSATKTETIAGISEQMKVTWTGIKYKDEAIADALAVYLTAKTKSNIFHFLTNDSRRGNQK